MRTENHSPGQAARPARRALDQDALRRAVVRPGGLWRDIEVVGVTGSTNADLLARAADGAPEGVVLAAEEQSAGRGRMGRAWVSPPCAALTFSVLLRPLPVPPARRGWITLLAGVAAASAVRAVTAVGARLKWPNDVLVGDAKLAGILAEAAADAVVVGIGVNVSTEPDELPPPGPGPAGPLAATSLVAEGWASPDRDLLLAAVLGELEHWYLAWRRAGGDPGRCGLAEQYARLCATPGRLVRVELPGGQLIEGVAAGIDPAGRLLVRVADGELPVAAGDVVHVR
ncbi:MAG TPA: biotin--[acetyl-CoA-carboxylase] ligase [Streptosporangiaceae bacterium]|nr:biotin--[acetyl-CoA-carboxylase] ligase [Streptosporangiaceae bacterium]